MLRKMQMHLKTKYSAVGGEVSNNATYLFWLLLSKII